MTPEALSGLPVAAQIILYALIGLGIAGGVVVSYFRTAAREKNSTTGLILAGDPGTIKLLTAAIERQTTAMDRLDASLERSTDAVRDSSAASENVRRALLIDRSMPVNEELMILLQRIDRHFVDRGGDKRG